MIGAGAVGAHITKVLPSPSTSVVVALHIAQINPFCNLGLELDPGKSCSQSLLSQRRHARVWQSGRRIVGPNLLYTYCMVDPPNV